MGDHGFWNEFMKKTVRGRTVDIDRGELLFLQGDPCREIGYVAAGSLVILSTTPGGRELPIQSVPEGDFFGDVLQFAGGTHYLGNVVAFTAATVVLVAPEAFLDALAADRTALASYLTLLARKTFFIKQQVKMLSLPDLRAKILFWLRWRLDGALKGSVPLPGSKERLAAFLAVERPSLSRELARMQRDGLIAYSRKDIDLL
jgi:CRP-like cAMP-binding protein